MADYFVLEKHTLKRTPPKVGKRVIREAGGQGRVCAAYVCRTDDEVSSL